jgi:hypothetical protein
MAGSGAGGVAGALPAGAGGEIPYAHGMGSPAKDTPATNMNTTARVTNANILFIQPPCAQKIPEARALTLENRLGNHPGHNITFRLREK